MTTVHLSPDVALGGASPTGARISFRQPVAATGFVDAAWWPRSDDLQRELPSLMDLMWTAGREITRVIYYRQAWAPAPRRMLIQQRLVRLGGFDTGNPLTVRLLDAWERERIDVLIIAPQTAPAVAERILRLVAVADQPLSAEAILRRADTDDDPDAAGPA